MPKATDRLAADLLSVRRRLGEWAAAESGRLLIFAPLFLMAGAAIYFTRPQEPPSVLPLLIAGLGAVGAVMVRRGGRDRLAWLAWAATLMALGSALADWRTDRAETPLLARPWGPGPLTGALVALENRPSDQRLTIAPTAIGVLPSDSLPRLVRVTWRGDPIAASPGATLSLFGQLMPPPGPAVPGGYDYGRHLYFEGIGGVGFLMAEPRLVTEATPTLGSAAWLQGLRQRIAERIADALPGPAGAVTIALVTGDRSALPPPIVDALRHTGLAHLLAISGLHMGLVCGTVFVVLRTALAAIPPLAARWPMKKPAALAACGAGIIYLALSGGPISAQRAFIMASIGFLAVLLDRRAVSLRTVAVAAIVIVAWRPDMILGAGFQMSFAAVTALVATYTALEGRLRPAVTIAGRVRRFVLGLMVTSLVAGLATAPMAIYHFNQVAAYGLLANLIVMPIFSLLIMPGLVLGLALMPFGADGLVWPITGFGLEAILSIATWIAGWEGAVIAVAQWPPWAFATVLAGGLALCLLRAAWRWGGLGLIALGLAGAASAVPPIAMIADGAGNLAIRDEDGEVAVLSRRRARFSLDQWRAVYGLPKGTALRRLDCPPAAPICVLRTAGPRISLVRSLEAAGQACRTDDIVILPLWRTERITDGCDAVLLTAARLEALGPVALLPARSGSSVGGPQGWRMTSVKAVRGDRPWVP